MTTVKKDGVVCKQMAYGESLTYPKPGMTILTRMGRSMLNRN